MGEGEEEITIGIVAGEASGDALGADLIRAVRARLPAARFAGIAGPQMVSAGCEAWYPMSKLALRGYVEVLSRVPELAGIRNRLRRRLLRARAPLFIGVDAPDFNLGLEAKLKRWRAHDPLRQPSVWAWCRADRQMVSGDRLLALFPFEPPLYAGARLPVTFVGHPLAAEAATAASRRETRELLKLDAKQPTFALLPGSRLSELEMHSELLLASAAELLDALPSSRFLVPLASRDTREHFDTVRHRMGLEALPIKLLYGHADHALKAADVGIVASGTATLEAALSRCPHLVFYRVNALTAWIVARKLLLPYVGLPNVLAGRFVVPEFLQARLRPTSPVPRSIYDDTVTRRRLRHCSRAWRDPSRRYGDHGGEAVAPSFARGHHADAEVDGGGRGPLAGRCSLRR
jgi:lipid-A-disaccharide synthase